MEESAIIAAIRRGIREPLPVTVSDADISNVIVRGVILLGHIIREVDPFFFNVRKSVSSYTHVFTKPTACLTLHKIWDLGGNAVSITAASNTSPIVITAAAHGLSDDDIVFIHDVGGNTAANGTFLITYINANSLSLDGSTGNGTYTSGGKIFAEPSAPDEIELIDIADSNLSHINKWYPRGTEIVIDDNGFTNDIIIDYVSTPDEISDIHSSYHDWLVSFGITDLIVINRDDPEMDDKVKTVRFHEERLRTISSFVKANYRFSSEPQYIRDVW